MQRRDFIKSAAIASVAATVGAHAQSAVKRPESSEMVYRTLGRTGERVSAIGLGGAHIGFGDEPSAIRLMHAAIDGGITFFDNCWDYNDGHSEERMGKALKDGNLRNRVFLMTKSDSHSAQGWNRQLDESLHRLQTDVIDLVQIHEVIRMNDPEAVFAPGGAIEAAIAARKAGKIRYIGFTGHKDPAIHLHMIDTAEKHGFHFDTVQMPVNIMDAHFRSFQHQVIPVANAKGIGVLSMKTFAFGALIEANVANPIDMLHYSMTLPISVVITGMPTMPRLQQALTAAKTFKPMTQDQIAALLSKSKDLAADGHLEKFKTSETFDGTSRNPEWLA
ncbi:MAG TPA: aldo/keto reductase [Acidobacteriaceae bacterium]|jgi:predicted aldo/keto reductase-like oxidoreductase|nr:aldo/keto reductase [Acidobacteriaceae bacterium]